jgi:cytoskeletal protein RodZ
MGYKLKENRVDNPEMINWKFGLIGGVMALFLPYWLVIMAFTLGIGALIGYSVYKLVDHYFYYEEEPEEAELEVIGNKWAPSLTESAATNYSPRKKTKTKV